MSDTKKGNRFVDRTGEIFRTKQGYDVQIIEYNGAKDCSFKFLIEEEEVVYKNVWFKRLRNTTVKNPYHPTVFGKGFMGVGKYESRKDEKLTKCYNTWSGVLERCYCEKFHKRVPTYKEISLHKEWHNFQIFAEWFHHNYNHEYMGDWHLDKDILVKNNKIYSPETCCFVPQEINSIFKSSKSYRGEYPIGVLKCLDKYRVGLNKGKSHEHLGTFETVEEAFKVYKTAKEKYIKEVADKWKDLIDPRVYEAMYNYQVEITE